METNFEKDITPDKFNLDIEWENQSRLYDKYAKLNVRAVAERDRIWQRRKVIRAELMLEILENYNKKELKKPTDAAIDAMIRTDKRHKEISEELINANEKASLEETGKWDMVQKNDALENLVKLFLVGYWAENPKIPQEAKDEADKTTRTELKRRLKK